MRVVIQRVLKAAVTIEGQVTSEIGEGLMILLGIQSDDTPEDIAWLTQKIAHLRIFDDEEGVMNRSVVDVKGDMLVVSQFTLMARTKKGNRPSYIDAAPPAVSVPLYEKFVEVLGQETGFPVKTGTFGADMAVSLINQGPVTIIIDSKNRI